MLWDHQLLIDYKEQYHIIKDICVLKCKIKSLSVKIGQRDFDLLTLVLKDYMDCSMLEKLVMLCPSKGQCFVDFKTTNGTTSTEEEGASSKSSHKSRTTRASRKANLIDMNE